MAPSRTWRWQPASAFRPRHASRRVRALEEAGVVTGYTALVDEKALGFSLTAFAMVGLHSQSEADLRAFEKPRPRLAHRARGLHAFGRKRLILKCVAPTSKRSRTSFCPHLTAAPNVASVKTNLTIRRAKLAPGVPVSKIES